MYSKFYIDANYRLPYFQISDKYNLIYGILGTLQFNAFCTNIASVVSEKSRRNLLVFKST